ncbi:putative F-box protein At1g31090 isoform X2 [Arabidopsis lyrata subsp. lyrata]|uniref:putative F-box protein At1g31090 isoform X2 n=1 Tax=Arabidopsis lyrata subsp. lyrata TaxID=81972 RepID=UPI000A29E212|nr:putative F-box protein At1g31090 isoform X2 [Arabidopsis lyrata subsp. lyrata]|eukprot:XP_020866363.1 putative F-box protein At1g31090 isoform X2 [Arabidopsis lyrata subsp. lyrata]
MNRGANSDSIPTDLIYEILSRLPAKSILRFRCVSKLWKSIICRQDFTELFHTRSSSNPRLLIGVEQGGVWSFFSSPQAHDHYGKSSLVVAADFHMKFSEDTTIYYRSYASGLIYFPNMRISNENDDVVRMICNPSTGQYAILPPDLRTGYQEVGGFFKGKLGVINLEDDYDDGGFSLKISMWVLENVEKHEWTTYAYTLRAENKVVKVSQNLSVIGVTGSGDIVLANHNLYKPIYVFYFNPERNTLLCVEIQGVREEEEWFKNHKVYCFVNHVEDLRFDVMKTTSISPPEQSTSTSSREAEAHQVRTVAHLKQDR